MAGVSGKKKLEQLKVAELRDLLEQRGLSKAGIKQDLVKRLKEAISKEDSMQPEETTEEQNEGKNEAGNAAEEAETMADGTDSQLDQSSSQLAQAKEASCAEPTAMEQSESEELAYEGESDMEKNAGRVARGEREGTPLQDENGEREKASKEDSDSKEPDPVIDLHVSEAMEMMIDDDVASQEEKSSPPPEEVNDSKKEVEQPSASAEPDHELPIERFSSSSRRHLWVSGTGGSLSKAIKAIDLKDFFSKYGQVVSASIVAPKSRYYPPKMYGFVTMKTEKEADLCIRELNLREVKGQKLLIEIAKNPPRVAPVDTYVDPSKAGETSSSPVTVERSQSRQEGDSSDTAPATLDRNKEEAKSEDVSGNPEGQNQSGSKEADREKKRGSPRGHELNRNPRPRDSSPKRRSPIARRLGDNRPRRPSPRRARSRSPPRLARRSPPPMRRRSPRGRSPPRGDLRRGLMADRRQTHSADGRGLPFDVGNRGILPDPPPPPPARGSMGRFEGRLEPRPEPRLESRMDPRSDIIVRTQNELFQRELAIQRHEKQLAQQMKMVRDREMKEKEMLLDQERRMREKEREILDRERRDRQLRDELERELKHKAIREKELIERERKELEEKQRILREKEERMEQEQQQKQLTLEAKERELKERERQVTHQSHSIYGMHAMAASSGQKRPYSAEASEYGIKRPTPSRLSSSPYLQTLSMKASLSGHPASASSASWGDTASSYSYGHIQETKKIVGSGGYASTASSGGSARSYYPQASSSITGRSPSETAYGGFQQHELPTHRSTPFGSQKQSGTPTWRSQPPTMGSASGGPRGYPLQSRPMGGLPSSGGSLMGMATPTTRGRPSLGQTTPASHMTTRYPPSRDGGVLRSPYQQPSQGGRPY